MFNGTGNGKFASSVTPEPVLRVKGLSKSYQQRGWFRGRKLQVKALSDVTLAIKRGATLALLGESGAGKSTLARCLALLERPTRGEVWFEGRNLLALAESDARRARRQIQLIFQDPSTALNPRLKASEIIAEPLEILRRGTRRERVELALGLMEDVGLSFRWGSRLPLEFSGGQRQRLAIARALASRPAVLILDEPLSSLDLPARAQIMALLSALQEKLGLSYVLISHDIGLVCNIATDIAVLYQGRLVEQARPGELIFAPRHPHTQALVAAFRELEPHPA